MLFQKTLLECYNTAVDRHNQCEITKLSGDTQMYESRDWEISKSYEPKLKHFQIIPSLQVNKYH